MIDRVLVCGLSALPHVLFGLIVTLPTEIKLVGSHKQEK